MIKRKSDLLLGNFTLAATGYMVTSFDETALLLEPQTSALFLFMYTVSSLLQYFTIHSPTTDANIKQYK